MSAAVVAEVNGVDQTTPLITAAGVDSSEAVVREGQAALRRLRGSRSWDDWKLVGAAHCVGRAEAMRQSQRNEPSGRKYAEAFSAWLKEHAFDDIDGGDRRRLVSAMDNIHAIDTWRTDPAHPERLKLHNPSAIWRAWRKPTQEKDGADEDNTKTRTQALEAARKAHVRKTSIYTEVERRKEVLGFAAALDVELPASAVDEVTALFNKIFAAASKGDADWLRKVLQEVAPTLQVAEAPHKANSRIDPPATAASRCPVEAKVSPKDLLIGWRELSADKLEARVNEIRRAASDRRHPFHFKDHEWRAVDRMRDRLRELRKSEHF